MKGLVICYWLFVISAVLLLSQSVQAAGLAVSPDKLELTGLAGQLVRSEFEVSNISDQTTVFQVSAENQDNWLAIKPKEFSLLPGSSRRVEIIANWPKSGQVVTAINILSRQLTTSTFSALAGVKLPLRLQLAPSGSLVWSWALLVGSLIVLLGVGLWQWQERRCRQHWWSRAFRKINFLKKKNLW